MGRVRSSCRTALGAVAALLAAGGTPAPPAAAERAEWTLEVTATAYNSLPGQTAGNPEVAAWGDRLEPGMRVIAVSRDLIPLGLGHEAEVRIEGLPGRYRVLDKLHRRWRRRIDIYMGVDEGAARSWGRRQVRIFWTPPGEAPAAP